jgi:hypothetical protein
MVLSQNISSGVFVVHPTEDGRKEPREGGDFPFSLDELAVGGDFFGNSAEQVLQSADVFGVFLPGMVCTCRNSPAE